MSELVRVRRAATAKGFAQFFRFVRVEIQPQQHVVRDAGEARHAAVARDERAFERRERERAAFRDGLRHRARLFLQLVVRHDLVDEPDLQRLPRA